VRQCLFTLVSVVSLLLGPGCMARAQPRTPAPQTRVSTTTLPPSLAPGSRPGTFRYEDGVKATFSAEPQPLRASVSISANQAVVKEVSLTAQGGELQFSVDLPPGTYSLTLKPTTDSRASKQHHEVMLPPFHIDKAGVIHFPDGRDRKADFIQKVTGMRPANEDVATAAAPMLRWDPVPGAAYYTVNSAYPTDAMFPRQRATNTQLTLGSPLKDDTECGWTVSAFAPGGRRLAIGTAWFLTQGSPPATQEDLPPTTAPAAPPVLLGIAVGDFFVPIDGTRQKTGMGMITIIKKFDRQHVRPVVLVQGVLPGSPAIDAGLMAGDQIAQVDGKPVEGDDQMKGQSETFLAYIRGLPSGAVVKLRVLREGEPPREVQVKLGMATR
jgi:hypothetical protein